MNRIYSKAQVRAVEDFVQWCRSSVSFEVRDRMSQKLTEFKREQLALRPQKEKKSIGGGMSVLPLSVRRQLNDDPFMQYCIWRWIDPTHVCEGNAVSGKLIEWEHPWIYKGEKIQERWIPVPLCWLMHQGGGLVKDVGKLVSLMRMTLQERIAAAEKYPRTDWEHELGRLAKQYPEIATKYQDIDSWLAKQDQN